MENIREEAAAQGAEAVFIHGRMRYEASGAFFA
jgi:hypothetical protein